MLGNFPQTARTFTIVPSVREPFEDGPRPGAVGDGWNGPKSGKIPEAIEKSLWWMLNDEYSFFFSGPFVGIMS